MRIWVLATMLALSPGAAWAHPGTRLTPDFMDGFAHPFAGTDHILAMAAVGLIGAAIGGQARWLVPAAFIAMMVVGGAAALGGAALPGVELGIALSVVVLGALIALDGPISTTVAMALAGLFALFHGHAHGAEMAAGSSLTGYFPGFVLATALLHAGGLAVGVASCAADGSSGRYFRRTTGGAFAAVGLGILLSAI